jgi:hypothetical protein
VTAVAAPSHPCRDCETGACPCGAACEGCDFTGDCSSCRGTGFVESPTPKPNGWSKKTRDTTGRRWGTKRPMEPCVGCDRAHKCDTNYYRMTPDEVLTKVMNSPGVRDRPRCTICCVPFGSTKSHWYQVAVSRGCATVGTFHKIA